jgi:hypothetical protein
MRGVGTGFGSLDRLLAGMQDSNLISWQPDLVWENRRLRSILPGMWR